ncbi:putative iron/ascorbate oxidoreductase [Lachnellula subtilissima]|uniref:Putative iron/ascorbate oxidoreductase n=1 Tax=Lachnellula subtilissima TaxID=602034 RepID=A0A8H8RU07_9HELO|nr:putative iron/ascorbate oxidoreductase [Lachnellula subtilissima]
MILARRMMKTFALGLGANETYFDSTVTAPFTSILLNYYPPQAPDGEDPESLIAHSEFGTFTIFGQDMLGGLEVLNKNGIYIPAEPMYGTFVVNVGDFLQRISNDMFVSTVHRVRNLTTLSAILFPFSSASTWMSRYRYVLRLVVFVK